MEIQKFMKGRSCYTTRDNDEVTLRHYVVVVPVLNYTHQPCINKYYDSRSWWTAVEWYLTDQLKSNQVLKNLATLELCYVKSWMTFDKPSISEVD